MTKKESMITQNTYGINTFYPADQNRFCANSVDPDEMACNVGSTLFAILFFISDWNAYFFFFFFF